MLAVNAGCGRPRVGPPADASPFAIELGFTRADTIRDLAWILANITAKSYVLWPLAVIYTQKLHRLAARAAALPKLSCAAIQACTLLKDALASCEIAQRGHVRSAMRHGCTIVGRGPVFGCATHGAQRRGKARRRHSFLHSSLRHSRREDAATTHLGILRRQARRTRRHSTELATLAWGATHRPAMSPAPSQPKMRTTHDASSRWRAPSATTRAPRALRRLATSGSAPTTKKTPAPEPAAH